VFAFWKALASAVDGSEQVHRFSDRRHTNFEGKPLLDGSNLEVLIQRADGTIIDNGSVHLRSAFAFYKEWLTFLHYDELLIFHRRNRPGSSFETNDGRITEELHEDLRTGCALLVHYGNAKVPERGRTFRSVDSLTWVGEWRDDIGNGLAWMQAARNWATLNNGDVVTAVSRYVITLKLFLHLCFFTSE